MVRVEVVFNELSLHGTFHSLDDFNDELKCVLKNMKIMKQLSMCLLRNYEMYNCKVTATQTLQEVLNIRGNPAITLLKRNLAALMASPEYWEDNPHHNLKHRYKCRYTDLLSSYGIAEACERDRIILSFFVDPFICKYIKVEKNGVEQIAVYNIEEGFLQYLLEQEMLSETDYCRLAFVNGLLDFSRFDERYGFDGLERESKKIFIRKFQEVDSYSWNQFQHSNSLYLKPYKPASKEVNWFSGTEYEGLNVLKFRVNDVMRVFGLRAKDKFEVLRLEVDHKQSDFG